MASNTTSPENEDGEENDSYNRLSMDAGFIDEDLLQDGVVLQYEDANIPYRDTDHISDVIGGLHVGDAVIIQIGIDVVDVYHHAEVVSRNPVGLEPFDWENVICFDLPPNDEAETRRYVAGEINSEVGLWYVVSFGYKSVVMNEIATDDMWGHGWIIDVARA